VSDFIYKLNAMENAAQEDNPAAAGYGNHRLAVIAHVEKLESEVNALRARLAAFEGAAELSDTPTSAR
jgi:uncharacterized protein YceH (UPF0502 family)